MIQVKSLYTWRLQEPKDSVSERHNKYNKQAVFDDYFFNTLVRF
jgi:hypothetical protein